MADVAVRVQITVAGIVQGVGFRPFVHNLAQNHTLTGHVRNHNGSVAIDAQGSQTSIECFVDQLKLKAPAASVINEITVQPLEILANAKPGFKILTSTTDSETTQTFVAADLATCDQCLAELFDPADRRYRYPFINCTNCGPRFTIIKSLPYDRKCTTMSQFQMCDQCQAEYDDPTDRRFHAQPNACPQCGPQLIFIESGSATCSTPIEVALALAVQKLKQGKIIAIKGLGGFQLICNALDSDAVQRMRRLKKRKQKPFAVMMRDLEMLGKYCLYGAQEEVALSSTASPIVLLSPHSGCALPDEIAPGIDRVGVMLPYTPLHHLLLSDYDSPIVATSGNSSEEPIAIGNEEAMERLSGIADCFVLHNRDIFSRYDDSVVQVVGGRTMTLRRARGLAPLPVALPFNAVAEVLACGAHLKSAFCLLKGNQAYLSQHIGDMENLETEDHFEQTLSTYKKLFKVGPRLIAHDLHPDYRSTYFAQQLAAESGIASVAVQHHHAHVASCMAEHKLSGPVIGVAFDGIGLGPDGTLWGGEFLAADYMNYSRLAHLEPVPLPGGELAIRQPWRTALGYIFASENDDQIDQFNDYIEGLRVAYGTHAVDIIQEQVNQHLNCPLSSSCGRLFDAAAALLGICKKITYEGQAAMELQSIASRGLKDLENNYYVPEINETEPPFVIKTRPLLVAVYSDFSGGVSLPVISAKFHCSIACMVVNTILRLSKITGIKIICLSGGVFQNTLLLELILKLVSSTELKVYFPQQVPANDGGLALGQAMIALSQIDTSC